MTALRISRPRFRVWPTALSKASAGERLGVVGAVLLAVILTVAVAAPLLAPYDPDAQVAPPFAPPSVVHPLGANDIGQDLLSELIVGTRVSVMVGIVAAFAATVIGMLVGLTAGFVRGAGDAVLMRLVDVMLALPFLPLMIVLGVFLGPGLSTTIIVIALVIWARPARELRAQVLSYRERGHVHAARAMGARGWYTLVRHIVPGVSSLGIPVFVRAVSVAILMEASLSFLGLGDPTATSWGTILYYASARGAFLTDAWMWWVVPPGICIAATVLAFALVGYALEERLHPRLRTARSSAATSVAHQGNREPIHNVGDPPPDGNGSPPPLLVVDDLAVEFATPQGVVRAVDGVSFVLRRGEALALVGESGSGKSTVATAVMRLLRPPGRIVRGRVVFDGCDMAQMDDAAWRRLRGGRIALVPQGAQSALNPMHRVVDQIAEVITTHQRTSRRAARKRAHDLLALVGIPMERGGAYPHELSGGMRQRVLIAMALANDPWLVIADEPTTGLDVLVQAEILALLSDLRTRLKLGMLFISHDIAAVLRVADQLAVMQAGRIIEQGEAATVTSQPHQPYTRQLLAAVQWLDPADPVNGGHAGGAGVALSARPVGGAPLLQLEQVCKAFRPRPATSGRMVVLDGVDLTVAEGECLGLVGASGAGKSTIARLVVGLVRPDRGRILFEGRAMAHWSAAERRAAGRRLHLIFQDPYDSLSPRLRVRDIVAEPLVIHGDGGRGARSARVCAALEAVSLTPVEQYLDRYPHELSGGERQRVALARAVVLQARLIVADEPTSMLDVSLRSELLVLMQRLRHQHGIAFLYITHDLALTPTFCDRLAILYHGRIVETGRTLDVIRRPRHPYTAALVHAAFLRPRSAVLHTTPTTQPGSYPP